MGTDDCTPVLIRTARDDLTKPFSIEELLARPGASSNRPRQSFDGIE